MLVQNNIAQVDDLLQIDCTFLSFNQFADKSVNLKPHSLFILNAIPSPWTLTFKKAPKRFSVAPKKRHLKEGLHQSKRS